MNINSIKANNFRSFLHLEEIRLGQLATIIGQNDTGKSNILKAIVLFLQPKPKPDISDIYDKAPPDGDIEIEMSFSDLPSIITIEEGVETTFANENLLDKEGCLRLKKIFSHSDLTKYSVQINTYDYSDDIYSSLTMLKEKDLNDQCKKLGIDVSKSGRGVTNLSKREAIRKLAKENNIPKSNSYLNVDQKSDLWKTILNLLPEFNLFETDTKLGVSETSFQSQFRPIIKSVTQKDEIADVKDKFTSIIKESLQIEVDKVYEKLKQYTSSFSGLTAKPIFTWDKAVSLELFGKDDQDVENSLDNRGSGMRRLLMVAFFQYLAERDCKNKQNIIFGVEEPENCLHPGLQREIIKSFRQLTNQGYQIIITSHSPVFASASTIDDLALVTRDQGFAKAIQTPQLDLVEVARELGIDPSDQITGFNACIFVEGIDDIYFLCTIANKFKTSGKITSNFKDQNIGFIPCGGGDTLKHWINLHAIEKINRKFGVMIDSDRKNPEDPIPGRKIKWKNECEKFGGKFYILRKREIENYLHSAALARAGKIQNKYNDFSDMKEIFGPRVIKVIEEMTTEEIIEIGRYQENGSDKNEIVEIVENFINLAT